MLPDAIPPPRAVVINLDELLDVEPHRCRTCRILLDEKFGDVDGFCAAHAVSRIDNRGASVPPL